MKLHITMYQDGQQVREVPEQVRVPEDREKVAKFVAREVKAWLREVPITSNGSRTRFEVCAYFTFNESADKPEKKNKEKSKKV